MNTKPCETCGKMLIGVEILQCLCHTPAKSVSETVSGEPEETLTHAERKHNARERKTSVTER